MTVALPITKAYLESEFISDEDKLKLAKGAKFPGLHTQPQEPPFNKTMTATKLVLSLLTS